MSGKNSYTLILLLTLLALTLRSAESKNVVIHIPYHVKNVKHTHTVYKIIPQHHHSKDDHKHDDYGEELEFFRKRR